MNLRWLADRLRGFLVVFRRSPRRATFESASQPRVDLGQTQLRRLEQYKDRWSLLGKDNGLIELSEKPTVARLKQIELFQEYDEKFLEKLSPDISIAKWLKGATLFEEGSYIDLAFYISQGIVDLYLQKHQTASQGQPIFDPSRTMILSGAAEIARDRVSQGGQTVFQSQLGKQSSSAGGITLLSSLDIDLPKGTAARLASGEIFGEIGAISGWPQSATARTVAECELVQIRVPALRLMRRRSKALKGRLDKLYRTRSLFLQLKVTPLFQACDDSFLQALADKVELISCEPDQVITREGEPTDALFMVRSGFVKLSQRLGAGNIVVSYLSKGMTLGEIELLVDGVKGWVYTASSKEYSELVKISRNDFQEIIKRFPSVQRTLWSSAVARLKESGFSRRNLRQSEFVDTALDRGLVEGNSILIIDLNVCTRCDDCVRGCAETHGGIPRFVREGEKYQNFLITRACYHCEDPVCLVGCPTGAIRRAEVGDVVEIVDDICIGCRSCANNCPYDAITMYETGERWPGNTIPEGLRGEERLLATKCDLCHTSSEGPACVNSCPHSCAMRVGNLEEFQKLIEQS